MNREVVEKTHQTRFGFGCENQSENVFDRKTISIPDLPKRLSNQSVGLPIVEHGKLEIMVGDEVKTINVTGATWKKMRVKSVHEGLDGATVIDKPRRYAFVGSCLRA